MEKIDFKGHFTCQELDKNYNILDEYSENNLIMASARESMSEIFAKKTSSKGIQKIVFGTFGYKDDNLTTPKTETEGYVKERTRLFSETIDLGDVSVSLLKNDVIKYTGILNGTGSTNNYYIYLGSDNTVDLKTTSYTDITLWKKIGTTKPFSYAVSFDLPGADGYALNLVEDDIGSNSTCSVVQDSTSVTFTIELSTDAANNVNGVQFTEAALYANDRIFSMKTFSAKNKNDGTILRVIWRIIF